jgi:hypothetical protein
METRVVTLVLVTISLLAASPLQAQDVTTLIVEIRTLDEAFAGTDDSVHLQIGGRDFPLDDPDRDDFERNNTDRFTFDLTSEPLNLEIIRGIGQISVTKIEDSFFGGGWGFRSITIWSSSTDTEPLYENASINKWLDGDDLEWVTTLGEPGWNVPEPPAFPPCTGPIIILFTGEQAAAANDTLDSDCDGTPDSSDPTFDPPTDSDGDGLPDLFETETGSNPNDSDSDDDGWADGRNRKSILVLMRIKCDDENEDIGSDELYLTSEDVRYPKSFDLDGYWSMNDGNTRSPGVIVDTRALPAGGVPVFSSRMRLRESDFTILENPTDDTFNVFDLEWDDDGTVTFTHDGDDAHYHLTFRWFTVNVRDLSPTANTDGDLDGLDDATEARMSLQDPSVQPVRIAGHDGLADPAHRELWVEVDASGSDQTFQFDSKQMVASQFAYHDISPRFDDGWFGNQDNGILPYQEVLTPTDLVNFRNDDQSFSAQRRNLGGGGGVFRYALLVDDLEQGAGSFGDARCAGGCRFIMAGVPVLGHTTTFQAQPVIFMHELGHTLTMCHRIGDVSPTNPPCPANSSIRCAAFCGIGQESTTAMGSETAGDTATPIIGGALTGIGAGIVAGALIGGLFGPPGAIVGAIIGGIVGGVVGGIVGAVLGADFYAREVDYHIKEWLNLRVRVN